MTLNEPLTFLGPVAFVRFNRLTGVQAFNGEDFELVFSRLVVMRDPFNVRLYADAGSFRSGPEAFFEIGMDYYRHGSFIYVLRPILRRVLASCHMIADRAERTPQCLHVHPEQFRDSAAAFLAGGNQFFCMLHLWPFQLGRPSHMLSAPPCGFHAGLRPLSE